MKSHLFKVKQMGVALACRVGVAGAVSEIETIFGLGLSVQSAVLLLTFRWYGRARSKPGGGGQLASLYFSA